MELQDHLRIVRKRLALIVVATFFCAAAALISSLAATPAYEGTAKLLLVAKTSADDETSTALQGAMLSEQFLESFAQILQSRSTAEAALRIDPQPLTAGQLQAKVHAEPITDTLLIELKVEDSDPSRARRLTNGIARAFIATVPRLQSGSALRVTLVEPALTPIEPVRPRTKMNIAVGLILGLMLGVGLAFLVEFLDHTVKTPEELEATLGVPVVGTIPPFKAVKQPIPVAEQPRTAAAEAFRKLRTNFAFLNVDHESICCVISSPTSGDGKSTVTANLGIALVQAGHRVVLVDADLRKPTLHKLFNLRQRVGTTTVLLDQASVRDALQHPGLDLPAVLTSGQLPPNPSELLGSRRMAELLTDLRSAFDVVLIDCPPLLPVTDPMVVSQFADGVLLITRAGVTTKDQVAATKAVCAKAGATLFGATLNATSVNEGDQPDTHTYYGEAPPYDTRMDDGLDRQVRNGKRRHEIEHGRAGRHRRAGKSSGSRAS